MDQMYNKGLLFDKEVLSEIREKFYYIGEDVDGEKRLFFENAGGSLRLKSVCQVSDTLNRYPDCYERNHKSSKVLKSIVRQGEEDVRTLFNAKDGAIATSFTASSSMFEIIEPIVEFGRGSNIVTTCLEHPSAFDACRYFGGKYGKEVRVAGSDRSTGGLDVDEVLKHVDKNTLLLVVIAASNMTGAITDLKTIAEAARKINPDIFIVTDAVQHGPHALLDVDDLKIDGMNIAPYKFFGNRGISFAYVSDRVKNLPHKRILDDSPDLWQLGSTSPAHFAAISEIVNYIAWIGTRYTERKDRRGQVEEGMKRIALHERALLHRMLYGVNGKEGLLDMEGVDTFFDYGDLTIRDLILPMKFNNIDYTKAVKEYEDRGVIVYERIASSLFSKRIVESFGLDGMIRVSPLHCNAPEEIDQFLEVTKEITSL